MRDGRKKTQTEKKTAWAWARDGCQHAWPLVSEVRDAAAVLVLGLHCSSRFSLALGWACWQRAPCRNIDRAVAEGQLTKDANPLIIALQSFSLSLSLSFAFTCTSDSFSQWLGLGKWSSSVWCAVQLWKGGRSVGVWGSS